MEGILRTVLSLKLRGTSMLDRKLALSTVIINLKSYITNLVMTIKNAGA